MMLSDHETLYESINYKLINIDYLLSSSIKKLNKYGLYIKHIDKDKMIISKRPKGDVYLEIQLIHVEGRIPGARAYMRENIVKAFRKRGVYIPESIETFSSIEDLSRLTGNTCIIIDRQENVLRYARCVLHARARKVALVSCHDSETWVNVVAELPMEGTYADKRQLARLLVSWSPSGVKLRLREDREANTLRVDYVVKGERCVLPYLEFIDNGVYLHGNRFIGISII
jgi:hypothetical protein